MKKTPKKAIVFLLVFLVFFLYKTASADSAIGLLDFYFYLDQNISPNVSGSVFSGVIADSNGYFYLPSAPSGDSALYSPVFTLPVPLSPTDINTSELFLYVTELSSPTVIDSYYFCYVGNYDTLCAHASDSAWIKRSYSSPYSTTRILKIPLSSLDFKDTSSLISAFSLRSISGGSRYYEHNIQSMFIGSDIDITSANLDFDYYFDGLNYFKDLMEIQIPSEFFDNSSPDFLSVTSPSPVGNMSYNNNFHFSGWYNSTGLYDTIRISLNYGATIYNIPINNPPLVTPILNQDWGKSVYLANGSYTGSIYLYDSVNDISAISAGLYQTISFTVSEGVAPPLAIKSTEVCGSLDVACSIRSGFDSLKNMFSDVLVYLFIPDMTAFNQFSTLKNELAKKPPFGYVTGIYTAINTISNDTANKVFVLEQVTPITNTIFAPIRTALSWLLYFCFGFVLFHRFKDINI